MSKPAHPLLTLGLDLGTSAVKVVALGTDGVLRGEGAAAFATESALPLQAEQNPADWLDAAASAMQALDRELTTTSGTDWKQRIAAIGITGQLPTLVCLTQAGALTPAITWKDGRADHWAAARLDAQTRGRMYRITGMPIDGRYLAPMLRFHFGTRIGDLTSVLSAKDYLLYRLTGRQMTEPSTAAGYGTYDLLAQAFSDELCKFWEMPTTLLPPLRPTNSLAGALTEEGAKLLGLDAGIPVSTGAADSVCASFSMAGLDEGIVAVSFGSSAVIIASSKTPRLDPLARYLATPHAVETWYGREMDLLATGTGYRWLSELFQWQDGGLDQSAAASIPGANGLTFTPYLAGGEQGALWNPRLFSGLLGLTLRHSRNDIARAYLEGVFFEIRRCVDVLAETGAIDSLRVSGNIIRSPSSLQMMADVLARPVGICPHKSPAAVGAAILARRLSGAATPIERQSTAEVTHPNPRAAAEYANVYQHYLQRAASCE